VKVCPFCNTRLDDSVNYCINCGRELRMPSLSQDFGFRPIESKPTQMQTFQPPAQFVTQKPEKTGSALLPHKSNAPRNISIAVNIILGLMLFLQFTFAPFSLQSDEENEYKEKYVDLESEHLQLLADYEQIQNDYNHLQNDYYEIQAELDEQNITLFKIQKQYENLSILLDQRNVSYDQLRTKYEMMVSNYTSAIAELEKCWCDLENLTTSYENLESNNLQLGENRSEIYDLYNETREIYSNLKNDYNELLDSYLNLYWNVTTFFSEMRMRNPYSWERDNFITPDDPDVQYLLETILGDDGDGELTWDDMNEIYDYINDRKDYSYDPYVYYPTLHWDDSVDYYNFPEFWSYPNETIKRFNESDKFAGDCEDFTNLLISLFFAEQNNNFVYGITLDTDPLNDGGGHATCFIRISPDSDIYIYDIAGNYKDGNKGSAEDTLEDYGYHWHWLYSDIDILGAYNPHDYEEFENNDEFLEWWEV